MASCIAKLKIQLMDIYPINEFYLNHITPRYKYENGQRTTELAGYVYKATNTDTFDQINVLVEGDTPLIQPDKLEELQSNGEKLFVEFSNAVIRPYYSERTKSIEDSIRAESAKIIKKEEINYEM